MATQVIEFKRGDTFFLECTRTTSAGVAFDLTGYTITAQVRVDDFLGDLTVAITDAAAGEFTLSATQVQTALWPVARINCDVQFDNVTVESTETFIIDNLEDITRAS